MKNLGVTSVTSFHIGAGFIPPPAPAITFNSSPLC